MPRPLNPAVITPIRAIRAHCCECQGGSVKAVRECATRNCRFWPYRTGNDPKRRGKGGFAPRKTKAHTEGVSMQKNTLPG